MDLRGAKAILSAAILAASFGVAPGAPGASPHDGWMIAERVYNWDEQPSMGTPRVEGWAVGTFRGQNGASGADEAVTIHPDGSAELRVRGEAPRQGSFAGETLTFDARVNRVRPARGGIVVDGAFFGR